MQKTQSEATSHPTTAWRLPKVLDHTGLSRTHLYRLVQQGKFPAPHKLSERVSAWDATTVSAWLADKFSGSQS